MKCPHCKKEIEIKENEFFDAFTLWFINSLIAIMPFAMLLTWVDDYTPLPFSIADGLKYNYGFMLIAIPILFYAIYTILYKFKKNEGKLFITSWFK